VCLVNGVIFTLTSIALILLKLNSKPDSILFVHFREYTEKRNIIFILKLIDSFMAS